MPRWTRKRDFEGDDRWIERRGYRGFVLEGLCGVHRGSGRNRQRCLLSPFESTPYNTGVNICGDGCAQRYVDSTGLASRVGRLNPLWNETDSAETSDTRFEQAMNLCGKEFTEYVSHVAKVGSLLTLYEWQLFSPPELAVCSSPRERSRR